MNILSHLLNDNVLGTPLWFWLAFLAIVLFLLVLDLGVLHRKTHEIGIAESLKMSAFYITIGLAFGGWVWHERGAERGMEYLTGFIVEKTLAMDNIFIIAMIFSFFAIPRLYQHRVLFWGILGVIVLRGIMIGLGAAVVTHFEWVLYLFAIFLIVTGIKMLIFAQRDDESDFSHNALLRFLQRNFRITKELHAEKFVIRQRDPQTGKKHLYVTPLFIALIMIEVADIIFAFDSIPAIFNLTTDTFVVYTSNVFAILGLRALYFALAAMVERFKYLKYALSVLLVFIGSKIFIADFLGLEKFPPAISLGVTFALLTTGVVFSLFKTRTRKDKGNGFFSR